MARLPDEPGVTVVTASIYAEQKHIAQIEFWACRGWDDIPPCGTSILSADVKVRQFVGLLYRQFEKVRWRCLAIRFSKLLIYKEIASGALRSAIVQRAEKRFPRRRGDR
jgi:hypothetical protein